MAEFWCHPTSCTELSVYSGFNMRWPARNRPFQAVRRARLPHSSLRGVEPHASVTATRASPRPRSPSINRYYMARDPAAPLGYATLSPLLVYSHAVRFLWERLSRTPTLVHLDQDWSQGRCRPVIHARARTLKHVAAVYSEWVCATTKRFYRAHRRPFHSHFLTL